MALVERIVAGTWLLVGAGLMLACPTDDSMFGESFGIQTDGLGTDSKADDDDGTDQGGSETGGGTADESGADTFDFIGFDLLVHVNKVSRVRF